MTIKLFYDLMSQPSRTLFIFFKLAKIPFESCPVALRKGEHLSEEFKENYSKFGKVPFIHDGNFRLSESVAVVRYLCREYPVDDHWYPKDSKIRAKVDEYLEWQHHNVRLHCALYFRILWMKPIMTGKKPTQETVTRLENNMLDAINDFERLFLQSGPFICGDTISVADIFAASELEQPKIVGFNPANGRPVLATWLEKVKKATNPYYDESHAVLYKMAAKSQTVSAKL